MALIPGTPSSLVGSMAQSIQEAFKQHYPEVMGKTAPEPNKQMMLLCVAIAEGVIKHLREHPEAFQIQTKIGSGEQYTATVKIN